MVARAVMRAWQASLAGSPPIGRVYRSGDVRDARPSPHGWQQSVSVDGPQTAPPSSERDDDPDIRIGKRDDIVPRRPGAAIRPEPDESFWTSHHFWKGIVVGAVIVLLVKTFMAVQAPFGVDWYGF
ncbi:MAG: hypothetical protein OEU92_08965 [Alphaproteobacteria bacterium]|nr:hypothetical protein [Alphaproteobacteria bacterium]